MEPLQEADEGTDLVAQCVGLTVGDVPAVGLAAQAPQGLPADVVVDDAAFAGVGDPGEVAWQPAFQASEVFVSFGQGPAGDEQGAQVGGDPLAGDPVQ
ncbi:hypothetical protein ACFCV9_10745 [Streptomyces sp. NPDC056367]|uniref:hypothetical protein n=1 Tax=Streptomyces sp. NPDC056367 TaxID=3345797 RepID=UPI0035D858DC